MGSDRLDSRAVVSSEVCLADRKLVNLDLRIQDNFLTLLLVMTSHRLLCGAVFSTPSTTEMC